MSKLTPISKIEFNSSNIKEVRQVTDVYTAAKLKCNYGDYTVVTRDPEEIVIIPKRVVHSLFTITE